MRVDDFDFDLPEDRIALRPASPRDAARLLVVDPGNESGAGDRAGEDGAPNERAPDGGLLEDRILRDLPDLLREGDLLVFNDTRVLNAQFNGLRAPRAGEPGSSVAGTQPSLGAAKVEVTLHKKAGLNVWRAFARPAKKLQTGDRLTLGGQLGAYVKEKGDAGEVLLAFEEEGEALDAAIQAAGLTPLPPYIARRRGVDPKDADDYQTVYARHYGSVAAPTAGLHFTEHLLERLDAKGIERCHVTLHVGAGTFLPVKAEDTKDHAMHSEWGTVSEEVAERINATKGQGRRVICVGTTSMRLVESAAPEEGRITPFSAETDIFITPGYRFRIADGLLTNFHLPRSTLFMLVSAFSGIETMRNAYAHAIDTGYRFYSYGDGSLLWRRRNAA